MSKFKTVIDEVTRPRVRAHANAHAAGRHSSSTSMAVRGIIAAPTPSTRSRGQLEPDAAAGLIICTLTASGTAQITMEKQTEQSTCCVCRDPLPLGKKPAQNCQNWCAAASPAWGRPCAWPPAASARPAGWRVNAAQRTGPKSCSPSRSGRLACPVHAQSQVVINAAQGAERVCDECFPEIQ